MRRLATFCLLLLSVLGLTIASGASEGQVYVVIVNPRNPASAVERTFVQDAFLKRVKHWPGDVVLRPADLQASSNARRRFSREVLGRSVEAIKAYWQQRIFSGRDVPPPEFDHGDKVVRYVLEHEGGVGYVPADVDLKGSKVVRVTR